MATFYKTNNLNTYYLEEMSVKFSMSHYRVWQKFYDSIPVEEEAAVDEDINKSTDKGNAILNQIKSARIFESEL
jgi:hypothetical protein